MQTRYIRALVPSTLLSAIAILTFPCGLAVAQDAAVPQVDNRAPTGMWFEYGVTIDPTADAFVQASEPTANFGTGDVMKVIERDANYVRWGYMFFQIHNLSGDVERATLALRAGYKSHPATDSMGIYIYDTFEAEPWSQDTLTWNSAPSPRNQIGVANVQGGGRAYYQWDVRDIVDERRPQSPDDSGFITFVAVPASQSREMVYIDALESEAPPLLDLRFSTTPKRMYGDVCGHCHGANGQGRVALQGFVDMSLTFPRLCANQGESRARHLARVRAGMARMLGPMVGCDDTPGDVACADIIPNVAPWIVDRLCTLRPRR